MTAHFKLLKKDKLIIIQNKVNNNRFNQINIQKDLVLKKHLSM